MAKRPPYDPFDEAAANISVPHSIILPREHEPHLFFDGDRFMQYLNASYDMFDVITYSQSKSAGKPPLKRVRRLIYGLKQVGCNTKSDSKKYCMNIHVKLYICYRLGMSADVFLGSQNLSHGTNTNIMYKVMPSHVAPLLQFFNHLWDRL